MTAHGPHIGLIGGLATKAGIFYYEQLQRRFEADDRTLDLTLRHADVDTVLAHLEAADRNSLGRYLGELSNNLFSAGATSVAISAIAPHMAIHEIATNAKGPIINVLDVVPATLAAADLDRVAVFGNRAVIESNIYGSLGPGTVVPLEPAMVDSVHNTYNTIVRNGKTHSTTEVAILADLADRAMTLGAQAVVLAGTDLSSFYAEMPPAFPYIDLAQAHLDQIVATG